MDEVELIKQKIKLSEKDEKIDEEDDDEDDDDTVIIDEDDNEDDEDILEDEDDDYEEEEEDIDKDEYYDDDNDNDNVENINNNLINEETSDDSEEDSDDDEEDFSNIKLTDNYREKIMNNLHILTKDENMINIENLLIIKKKYSEECKCDVIDDENHITIPILSKYERARVLGLRARQINTGSLVFTDVDEEEIDGYKIAEKELNEKKIPFIIKRPLPSGKCEYWRVSDLEQI